MAQFGGIGTAIPTRRNIPDLQRGVADWTVAFAHVAAYQTTCCGIGNERPGLPEVRRDSAVKLVDALASVSPAGANCPVGTVVISGDGADDQTVGSPEVKALDGWMQIWSAPTGGQAKQQVVAQANRG